MKKVEVERLVSKAIIITVIICCIMFGMWLIQQGYESTNIIGDTYVVLAMRPVTTVLSVALAIISMVFIGFGVKKSVKFLSYAPWFAGLAILSLLLKINYEVRGLEFIVNGTMIKFFPLVLCVLVFTMFIYWIVTIVKIVRN